MGAFFLYEGVTSVREYDYNEFKEMVNARTQGMKALKREPKPLGVRSEAEADLLRYVAMQRMYEMQDCLKKVGEREYEFCPPKLK